MKTILTTAVLALAPVTAMSAPLETGRYHQVSSNAGDCQDCDIDVTRLSASMFAMKGSNGWNGFALYGANSDTSDGYVEFSEKNEGYTGPIRTTWRLSGGTLTMSAFAKAGTIEATFTKVRR